MKACRPQCQLLCERLCAVIDVNIEKEQLLSTLFNRFACDFVFRVALDHDENFQQIECEKHDQLAESIEFCFKVRANTLIADFLERVLVCRMLVWRNGKC